ncbi:hypothetical protein CsatA_030524 [Cannabis sativa]
MMGQNLRSPVSVTAAFEAKPAGFEAKQPKSGCSEARAEVGIRQPNDIVPKSSNKEINGSGFEPQNHQYTYAEVMRITNNFEKVIGKGGFGTVYHGFLNNTQVAVKMLSESSAQGYKELQAEVYNF